MNETTISIVKIYRSLQKTLSDEFMIFHKRLNHFFLIMLLVFIA